MVLYENNNLSDDLTWTKLWFSPGLVLDHFREFGQAMHMLY